MFLKSFSFVSWSAGAERRRAWNLFRACLQLLPAASSQDTLVPGSSRSSLLTRSLGEVHLHHAIIYRHMLQVSESDIPMHVKCLSHFLNIILFHLPHNSNTPTRTVRDALQERITWNLLCVSHQQQQPSPHFSAPQFHLGARLGHGRRVLIALETMLTACFMGPCSFSVIVQQVTTWQWRGEHKPAL